MFDSFGLPISGPYFDGQNSRRPNLYKGGGAPKQSKNQKKLEQQQMKLLEQQLKDAKKPVEMPEIQLPPPAPPPPPPPTASSADAEASATEARQNALKRRGVHSTLLSSEGAYQARPLGGNRTLLG